MSSVRSYLYVVRSLLCKVDSLFVLFHAEYNLTNITRSVYACYEWIKLLFLFGVIFYWEFYDCWS